MHNIEPQLTKIINNLSKDEFIFDFLLAYSIPKSNIARVRKGDLNKLEEKGELILRKKVYFKISNTDLYSTIDNIKNDLVNNKSKPRFVIVTNFEKLLSFDTKIGDTLDIDFNKLDKHYDFFLPLIGVEKTQYQNENIADVKAANNLAKLFDEIVKDNKHDTIEQRHALNIFLSRLLFCYFAEDTNIFTVNQFTDSLASHTKVDGSDTPIFLEKLFEIFNTKNRDDRIVEYFKIFPYVNGKLFENVYDIPKFTTKSRKLLIELGKLDWSGINPDIFGSMMQAVMDTEERGNMGSHYTSVPNIMKVINPLFLDELNEEFENSIGNNKKLNTLLERLSKIKFFDPACGSGNFLIIAYKEIRRLEIEILKEIGVGAFTTSVISLSQFYGIELNDFAHETAKLSLYLAEHQMNVEFYNETGIKTVSLPLKLGGKIVCGNATRVDWEEVCPKEEGDEIYIMGNPPYIGSSMQDKIQKDDLKTVCEKKFNNYKNLDYISCWFIKGANYILDFNIKFAFVSTNSITQGEQVGLLWPYIFNLELEIDFAYTSFKWSNNARGQAGVSVVIIGLRNYSKSNKFLFSNNIKKEVKNINSYLIDTIQILIERRSKSISGLPLMIKGNQPTDGGYFILSSEERIELISENIKSKKFIKKYIGSSEFINGKERWCIWIEDINIDEAKNINFILKRINNVGKVRLESSAPSTRNFIKGNHRFIQIQSNPKKAIIIPSVSSDRRKYIPIGIVDNETVISNLAFAIYDYELYLLGILSSHIHTIWTKTVAGRLGMGLRYSNVICYNTFPFPYITKKQKEEIEEYVYQVLDEREKHSEKTLAEMYDPDKMPEGLRKAHHELDLVIERCYRPKPFDSDEERLEYLFKMYEKMIAKEKENNK